MNSVKVIISDDKKEKEHSFQADLFIPEIFVFGKNEDEVISLIQIEIKELIQKLQGLL